MMAVNGDRDFVDHRLSQDLTRQMDQGPDLRDTESPSQRLLRPALNVGFVALGDLQRCVVCTDSVA